MSLPASAFLPCPWKTPVLVEKLIYISPKVENSAYFTYDFLSVWSSKMLTGHRTAPRSTGNGTQVVVRMQPQLLAALDKFVKEQRQILTRPEGVRMLLARALADYGYLPDDDGEDHSKA